MAKSVFASAFFEISIFFPRDVFTLVTWMMARDGIREEASGDRPKTTVWEVCDAVAYMSGVDPKEVERKFREAGIDMEAFVETDPENSPLIERIIDDASYDDNEEFLDEGEFLGDDPIPFPGKSSRRLDSEAPESITFELTASDRKLVLKHGQPKGGLLALLDQHTRNLQSIVVQTDPRTFTHILVYLTHAAVKCQGKKYDALSDLIGYMLQEAEEQGLDLRK
ncbi:hypothetical protein KIH39_20505 [Telmatocola sphagniphila]|uniref:Uncharacterized protein n=1 Tax=Telmatocola sphagniphila TaxID=1123043 RepID=A0A8E6B4Z8_9BACT|nr:hypothetical protein [Telmatocola sphagniphila]QVL31206.1 hypothetical protein KIH39_20505 [Telmatocola sphagniphila]